MGVKKSVTQRIVLNSSLNKPVTVCTEAEGKARKATNTETLVTVGEAGIMTEKKTGGMTGKGLPTETLVTVGKVGILTEKKAGGMTAVGLLTETVMLVTNFTPPNNHFILIAATHNQQTMWK